MSKPLIFKRSPEDESTYVRWRRGVFIFYTCVGLAAVGVILAAHLFTLGFSIGRRLI
jgi:hypothetical protein